ncbi:MAG: o-succinylbenzoate synthase [Bacteroidales bacterium]|nr:o-succinylbenzoate synthase [Bacteroidales bacterium]
MADLEIAYSPYTLRFKAPATTSRATMTVKDTYFIKVYDPAAPERYGLGECALFRGLSMDDVPVYEETLQALCRNNREGKTTDLSLFPSITFGLETALHDYINGCERRPFPTPWSDGEGAIETNGLVWMGSIQEMTERMAQKVKEGFRCVKVKIGAQDFNRELQMLDELRCSYGPDVIELRLDANGAFSPEEALDRLERLAVLDIHSIEQPIAPRQWDKMSYLCENSPIPIALDEELIGITDSDAKRKMLYYISPRYIILKPALCGGIAGAEDWISIAASLGIDWWATSALESNVGLNAIAQWASTKELKRVQGLGTGGLYINNVSSPLVMKGPRLAYDTSQRWEIPQLEWQQ